MLALSFTFPAGRYHATPWDRHVNEGAVAWPPEPWRILRGLIAAWHHKVKFTGKHSESTLQCMVDSLAQTLPRYRLPAANHSHVRHYMPQFGIGKTSLVLDAFAAVKRDDALTVMWPNLELPAEQRELLDKLVSVMGYLGRAESWVEARRITDPPEADCVPGLEPLDRDTGELKESVRLYVPLAASEYQSLRESFLTDKKAQKKLGKTLPGTLLEALSVETTDLRKQGWSQPPAARKVSYIRPVDALRPRYSIRKNEAPPATTVSFVLVGKPLPRVEDSLRIGELMRHAVMSACKRILGEDNIPPVFSGHDLPPENRHRHAFYLPCDTDGDGCIDRLVLHVPEGMDARQQQAVQALKKLWSRDGGEWRVALESIGGAEQGGQIMQRAMVWLPVTPYLHPWHVKNNFTVEDQLRRECLARGLPEPIGIEPRTEIDVGRNRKRRPIHYRRFRSKRVKHQPDRLGGFWQLTFGEPVQGPIALGFACHYGLGLFRPIP
jgi:CRISPR-associated protein Csb2